MKLQRAIPMATSAVALLATTASVAVLGLTAAQTSTNQAVSTTATVAAVLEGLALASLLWTCVSLFTRTRSRTRVFVEVGSSALCSVAAAAASIATLARIASSPSWSIRNHLVGCAAAFSVSLTWQAVFIATQFIVVARTGAAGVLEDAADGVRTDKEKRKPTVNVKSIPYSRTATPAGPTSVRDMSFETIGVSTFGARSRSTTINSAHSSIVQPKSSKLSKMPPATSTGDRGVRRAISLDSTLRPVHLRPEDAQAESWEMTSVNSADGIKVDVSPSLQPESRFLETIPASPTMSNRTSSPGLGNGELDIPRGIRRSRSYSTVPSRESFYADSRPASPSPLFATAHGNTSEAHIHPLFRSDSPVPPPAATPGTVVTASPDAGRILAGRQSVQSLRRMRSDSLPLQPSPLNRQKEFEDFSVATQRPRRHSRVSPDARSSRDMGSHTIELEAQATPHIPGWKVSETD